MQKIHNKVLKDTMFYHDIPVLTYEINYPFFETTCSPPAACHISGYYALMAEITENNCRTNLYSQAVQAAQYIPENIPPFNSYEFLSDYHTAYNKGCIVSLYTEQYSYSGGAHGATVRSSDTWDFCMGRQIKLAEFFPGVQEFPECLFCRIEKQIEDRLKESPSSFFEDYHQLLRNNFHAENFYITPAGLVIYYQQYDIAPYASGIPEFVIPFRNSRSPGII